jgi:hypothetical protein
MNAPAPPRDEKALNGLLLAALFVAGLVLMREGPHFDNVIDGWPFFTSAFFAGTLIGFLVWTYSFGVTPSLKFSGSNRQPWLAALVLGLVATASASYINRTFAAPTDRAVTAEIDSIDEGKGNRWHVTVKTPDGRYQRYLISKEVADALKAGRQVRMSIARGALGFDFIAKFEPAPPGR